MTIPTINGGNYRRRIAAGLMLMLFAGGVLALTGHNHEVAPVSVRLTSASGTSGLDPVLARAFLAAQADASREGVPLWITSGKRSHAEQQQLWENGVRSHGSPDAARRWVLPPDESAHVSGHAIDVGPVEGARWLERNGARYGLCRTYENEWWHFELATVPGGICPPMVPDASWPRPTTLSDGGNLSIELPDIPGLAELVTAAETELATLFNLD
ncbi:M15 family metallopeptidase [Hoyosella subflava]|uniref:D-alanyl-D-alanine carboxypeptidase-like core domain-containing protein n=1 Tax=Hoyosella subflava (strain DSM 45089 / JCM 17490 / NBRC 109087 / DQS3-9A1) TaxID=443218 RepID=F6EJT6_HOYSD|nr:M15 family metallopeptidase [Hoyosella subflava]AEF40111.1 hypothetical protein AS9A_1662 [Hoyosella subflava DQS3-9A1]